jgi:hypothetical protein
VALVLGIIGLLWTSAEFFHTLYGTPSSTQVALLQTFPSLQTKSFIGLSFALMGNTVLVIGALMAHLNHPNGAKVVRVTSYSMIALTVLLVAITCFAVFGADAWPTLDAPTKGAMIAGLVGGIIGAVLQWGLIVFLFRERKTIESVPKGPEPPSKWLGPVSSWLIGIPFALITIWCALVALAFPFSEHNLDTVVFVTIVCSIGALCFGWLTYNCLKGQ